ncbi:GumC family protein [Jannaschia pohangensis]|uniref:Uncharacterized protein involved in exopolysaccharide biosynthesis n=1 Tax=Jannaschia pohangensis TaxID=390807 RepID=A0A1I3QQR4_9RHOB|nr:polysaccharide biosynthesis tyrosine autokinase [Jannaschia pohangensis]SFJ36563.1 Uncharacterized protein involved in exopolysaccharide biosynthesis [Jannaschia pohangensis]
MPGPEGQLAEEGIELSAIFAALWRRKWLIAALSIGMAMLFWLVVSQIPPRYTARASVMLDGRSIQVLESVEVVSDLTLNNPVLDSEVTVLRSNLLLMDVLRSFEADRLAPLDPALDEPSLRARIMGTLQDLLPASSTPDAATGPALMTPEEMRIRRLTIALRRAMTVWREGQSNVISVSVETEDAELSMLLANRITEVYIARQVDSRTRAVRGANDFLSARADTLRAEVELAETAVEDFRRDQLASGGASAESLDRQLIDLSTQIALARADLATAEARARQIQSVVEAEGLETAAELLSSPFVLSLREQKSELEREDLALSTRLRPEHPDRTRIRNDIEAISQTLADEVQKIIASLENEVSVAAIREQSLSDSLAGLEARAADLSRASLALRQLERQAEAVRGSYEAALIRASETQSIESLQRADAVVIESATIPGAPSAPRVMLFTVLGGTVGLAIGLVLATLLSILGPGFARVSELERATGLPVVAALPVGRWRTVRKLLESIEGQPYQPYVERLRQVRTALAADGAPRTILVASSQPNEGKTTFCVSYARLETMSRKSCLLLDFDMRKSSLAKDLAYDPEGGDLADVFYGTCPLDQAICRSESRGFDLLTTRTAVPHLFDQVGRNQLDALLNDLIGRYDTIIIDTAPILAVADTLPVVRHVDATVLLVRARSTERRSVTETLWRLRNMGARQISLAFSMVDRRDGGKSYGDYVPYIKK